METPSPLVVFDRVTKRFGAFKLAVSELSFSIARGEFVVLSGASGAGKSTVLRLICALEDVSSGQVLVGGENLSRLDRRKLPLLRRSMGVVLQELLLLTDRSVLDNVMLPALASGLDRREAQARARAALERVGIDAHAALPQELSGGEQQRVALARAIVNRPALVLADEPTAHLDRGAAAGVLQLLGQFVAAGVTVIVASHGELAAVPDAARVLALTHGRLAP